MQALASAYSSAIGYVEFASIIITLLLVFGIVNLIIKTGWFKVRKERIMDVVLKSNMTKERVMRSWQDVERHFFKGDENDLKVALLEADKLLDEALREAGIRGSHLGDRLKNVKDGQIPNVDAVWQAHKLRNQIAH